MKKIIALVLGLGVSIGIVVGVASALSAKDSQNNDDTQKEEKPVTEGPEEQSDFDLARSCWNDISGINLVTTVADTSAFNFVSEKLGYIMTSNVGKMFQVNIESCEYTSGTNGSTNNADSVIGTPADANSSWFAMQYVSPTVAFTISSDTGALVKINPSTRTFAKVHATNTASATVSSSYAWTPQWKNLKYVSDTEIYALDSVGGALVKINSTTGVYTRVGAGNASSAVNEGWENFQYVSPELAYALSKETGSLIRINPKTGTFNRVSYDNADKIIDDTWTSFHYVNETTAYSFSHSTGTLIEINPTTGTFRRVGTKNANQLNYYGTWKNFHYLTPTLAFAVNTRGMLLKINPKTGEMK